MMPQRPQRPGTAVRGFADTASQRAWLPQSAPPTTRRLLALPAPMALLSLLGLLASPGCEETGEARIAWTLAGEPVLGPHDCSRHGVERVVVTFADNAGQAHATVERPCGRGETGVVQVPTGRYQVRVQAYGPTGQPFEDPATGETSVVTILPNLEVSSSVRAAATADLTPNPACADFVDNDGDGLVDASDPGCHDKTGAYDPDPNRGEEDEQNPGILAVTWQINGGRDSCGEVRPNGATTASIRVDGLETGRFPCGNGSGQLTLSAGPHQVVLALLGPEEEVLAVTPAQDASLVQDVTSSLAFDVLPGDFDPLQTGLLRLALSWGSDGISCSDASPMVTEQAIRLEDAAHILVEATTLQGVPADGSFGACVDTSIEQGISEELPVGIYWLTVTGRSAGGQACWQAADLQVRVDIGPNPAHEVVVPVADATDMCSP